jgi:RimJ/RimL family protein N-acetyltransferase
VSDIRLVPAVPGDVHKLFELRNHPANIPLSESGKPIGWTDHEAWFARCLRESDRNSICLIQDRKETIGVVRFHREDAHTARVSIYLLPEATGRGIGTRALQLACHDIAFRWNLQTIVASILADNKRSLVAFAKAGFSLVGADGPVQRLVLRFPSAD